MAIHLFDSDKGELGDKHVQKKKGEAMDKAENPLPE